MINFTDRIIRVAKLDINLYEEVETDKKALGQSGGIEPMLYPIKKILPLGMRFGIDISPIIAFLGIIFLKSFLVRTLLEVALRVR